MATTTGLSAAAYLRNVGLGYQVRSILDNKRVEGLARINGDLGRLGGLSKLSLTDNTKTEKLHRPSWVTDFPITEENAFPLMRGGHPAGRSKTKHSIPSKTKGTTWNTPSV